MLQEQPKFTLDRTVSETNAKVKPITELDCNMRTVSMKVSRCRSGMESKEVWLGYGTSKSQKRRTL